MLPCWETGVKCTGPRVCSRTAGGGGRRGWSGLPPDAPTARRTGRASTGWSRGGARRTAGRYSQPLGSALPAAVPRSCAPNCWVSTKRAIIARRAFGGLLRSGHRGGTRPDFPYPWAPPIPGGYQAAVGCPNCRGRPVDACCNQAPILGRTAPLSPWRRYGISLPVETSRTPGTWSRGTRARCMMLYSGRGNALWRRILLAHSHVWHQFCWGIRTPELVADTGHALRGEPVHA